MNATDSLLTSPSSPSYSCSTFYHSPPCTQISPSISKVEAMLRPCSPDSDSELLISSSALMTPSVHSLSQSQSGSPTTPLRSLLTSSPSGFWKMADSSMSPIFHDKWCRSCHSQSTQKRACDCDDNIPKLASLEQYQNSQQSDDSERIYSAHNALSSPCSLSSLSSISVTSSASGSPTRSVFNPFLPNKHESLEQGILTDPQNNRSCLKLGNGSTTVHRNPKSTLTWTSTISNCAQRNSLLVSRLNSVYRTSNPESSRKRPLLNYTETSDSPCPRKRQRIDGINSKETFASHFLNRTFPLQIPIHEDFPLFYRRFPVSSVPYTDGSNA